MDEATREFRFVLLGNRPHDSEWHRAVEESDRHRIVAALASDVADVPTYDHWQSLVADNSINAGLLFRPGDDALEAARQMAVRGRSLVIDQGCRLPSSFVAELALLDEEATTVVVPFFEWRAFPAFRQLRQLVDDGKLGPMLFLRITRSFSAASLPDGQTLNDEWIGESLTFDIDLLRWIGGDYSQVTLVRTGAAERGFAGQSLNLAGEGLPDAACEYRVANDLAWTLEVRGTSGTACVEFNGEGMRLLVNGEPVSEQKSRRPDRALCLDLLDDSFARRPGSLRWRDRVRIHEIQAAMARSLARRRTIDLHFETTSERSLFKTQMATVGCFVLMYTFFASVLLMLAGAVFDPRDQLQRHAEAAGFVVPVEDFEPQTDRLTDSGMQRLSDIANHWLTTEAVVIVEGDDAGAGGNANLSADDRARLDAVRRRLAETGVQRVEERTVVRRLAGQSFQTLMLVGRVIAFAPLGIFLLLQMLLVVTRPAPGKT